MIKNLRLLRTEKNISQQQLADVINTSQQSINKYENHNVEPDINTLIKLAEYFETSVDYLIGYTDDRRSACYLKYGDLTPEEISLLKKYRALSNDKKECIKTTISLFNK